MTIEGKILLVTGASSGIGAAVARAAARRGAFVILIARNRALLEEQVRLIEDAGGRASYYVEDLGDSKAVSTLVERIQADHGVPDILVNNAGSGQWKSTQETSPEEAEAMINLPYLAAFTMTRQLLPGFLERNSGSIVNITSAASYLSWPGSTAYMAARWALRGFTRGLEHDLAHTGINVSLAVFAKVSSAYWQNNPGSEEKLPGRQSWIRTLSPDEVAMYLLRGIEGERRRIIDPLMLRLLIFFGTLFPFMVK